MKDVQVIAMAFGAKARKEAAALARSLSEWDYELTVVGDEQVEGCDWHRWEGESPFDASAHRNFQFHAGRVKPFLHEYVEARRALYLDTDCRIVGPLDKAFEALDSHDMCIAEHAGYQCHRLCDKAGRMWPQDDSESAWTGRHWGTMHLPYWNSGVIFWRPGKPMQRVFKAWHKEWLRFAQWDEQLALMRAVYANPVRLMVLPVGWNAPLARQAEAIHHWYGIGTSRHTVKEPPSPEQTFSRIYRENRWASEESRSGVGSEMGRTNNVRAQLPWLLDLLGVRSILDAGCGDLNWMQHLTFEPEYVGVDVVSEIVSRLEAEHAGPGRRFACADVTADALPKCDLILCRTVLCHMPLEMVRRTLDNFKASGARWLLTTTYPFAFPNKDVKLGGWWRLNLQAPPFNMSPPKLILPEDDLDPMTPHNPGYLALWEMK